MPRKTNRAKEAARRARAHRWPKSATTPSANTVDFAVNQPSCENDAEAHENECMDWDGSLNHFTVEELEQSDTDDDDEDTDVNEEFMELEGDELLQSLQLQGEREQATIEASSTFRELQRTITKKEWKKAESLKQVVYSGHPGKQKGMKAVLEERGLWKTGLLMECKTCDPLATHCCTRHIPDLQPDFVAQISLVQEVIMTAGHLCIFLLKFHCELNFIEFFWGAVKKYL